MSYLKYTTIGGYNTSEPKPPSVPLEKFDAAAWARWSEWFDKHGKTYVLSGHWKIGAAIAYARRRGVVSDLEVTYTTSDTSGHGRGGIDGRWLVTAAGEAIRQPVFDEEDAAQRVMEEADAWD